MGELGSGIWDRRAEERKDRRTEAETDARYSYTMRRNEDAKMPEDGIPKTEQCTLKVEMRWDAKMNSKSEIRLLPLMMMMMNAKQ